MLLKRTGFPPEEELVLCTVTGINPHSVFCTLDEYGGRTGMIHISEIAPGRIRNIKEYVQEGKKVVCKVIQINKEKGHIDLSLRRVNESQKRYKLNEIKQQQFIEKIIEQIAKQHNISTLTLYTQLATKLEPKHGTLFKAFEEVTKGNVDLKTAIDEKTAKELTEAIKTRIKPPEIRISGKLTLTSYAPNGIDEIKDTLSIATDMGINVRYLGAGIYHLEVTAEDYKDAEKKLRKAVDPILEYAEEKNMTANWERKEE